MPTSANSASDAAAIRPTSGAARLSDLEQRQAEEHGEQQHLQDVPAREGADDGVGNDVQEELDRAVALLGGAGIRGDRVHVGGRRIEADAAARLHHVDDHQADGERQHRGELEVDQRAEADPADLLHRAHLRDADDHRGEHDRRDQHLHQLDEAVAERLHRRGPRGVDEPEDDTDGNRRQHLHVQVRIEFSQGCDAQAPFYDGPIQSPPVAARRPPHDALQLGRPAALSRGCRRRRSAISTSHPTRACWRTATGSRGRGSTPTLVALHGLNGSSDAHYMRGIAAKAFARGMNVVRLNQRNCGDTEHLSAGLFHSGLTADAEVRRRGADRGRRPAGDRRGRAIRSAATWR